MTTWGMDLGRQLHDLPELPVTGGLAGPARPLSFRRRWTFPLWLAGSASKSSFLSAIVSFHLPAPPSSFSATTTSRSSLMDFRLRCKWTDHKIPDMFSEKISTKGSSILENVLLGGGHRPHLSSGWPVWAYLAVLILEHETVAMAELLPAVLTHLDHTIVNLPLAGSPVFHRN